MKKILYLECYSGISGDMTVASLLDLGADRKVLEDALASLHVDGYEIKIGRTFKCGIDACDFDVILDESAYVHDHEHHHDHDEHDHEDHDHEHHHDHDEHDHDDHCCCGHHHDHDDDDDEHEHEHHHDHDEHDHDHEEHEHHHDHDGHCCCGHHHHDHHADEVFTSWGVETARKFTKAEVEHALTELDTGNYGMILRSKGIVDGGADGWLEFDYVPGEWEVRSRSADVGGKLVVIGSKLNETAIAQLFGC